MRRVLVLALGAVLGFSVLLAGCDGIVGAKPQSAEVEATPMAIGQPVVVEGLGEATLLRVSTGRDMEPSMESRWVLQMSSGSIDIIDVMFDYTNNTDDGVYVDEFIKARAVTNDGTELRCEIYGVESEDMNRIYEGQLLAAHTTQHVHLGFTTDADATNYTIYLEFNEQQTLSIDYAAGSLMKYTQPLQLGQTLQVGQIGSVTFDNLVFTDRMVPPDTSSFYTYYDVTDPAKTFCVAAVTITNTSAEHQNMGDFVGARVTCAGETTPFSGMVLVKYGGKDLSDDSWGSIGPGETTQAYLYVDVPDEWTSQTLDLSLFTMGYEYVYQGMGTVLPPAA